MNKKMLIVGCVVLSCFLHTFVYAGGSGIEFPYFTYGNISQYSGGKEDIGLKFDAYAEQGVDWVKFGNGIVFNTFVGINGTFSTEEDRWWDNTWGPAIGAKVKVPIPGGERAGGELALGLRGEHHQYTGGAPFSDDNRVVIFAQWYFGGKW